MTADNLPGDPEAELDRCIDQLLATGTWEARFPRGKARDEVDGLMAVSALLRGLTRYIARPRPGQKDRLWGSLSTSVQRWGATAVRRAGRLEVARVRTGFGTF